MTLHHIAPVWARWVIPPAVVGMGALGCYLAFLSVKCMMLEKSWFAGVMVLPVAVFPLYIAYRGIVLVQFRNTRAAVLDGRLFIQRNSKDSPAEHGVSDVVIVDSAAMQIRELKSVRTGQRLLAIDHLYPKGMALLHQVKQEQDEQG